MASYTLLRGKEEVAFIEFGGKGERSFGGEDRSERRQADARRIKPATGHERAEERSIEPEAMFLIRFSRPRFGLSASLLRGDFAQQDDAAGWLGATAIRLDRHANGVESGDR